MFRRIDQSARINRFLQRVSATLARNRGVPIVAGIVMIAIGFVCQLVNFFAPVPIIELLAIIFHGVGLVTALVGILLLEPLGR